MTGFNLKSPLILANSIHSPKVLSGHLKITLHFSYKHTVSLLLYYHVEHDGRTEIVSVVTFTLSLHFAIEMLKWLRYPSKNVAGVSRVLA